MADALVRESGLSFREAHHVVGAVVRQALDASLPASDITAEMVNAAATEQTGRPICLSDQSVRLCLDPAYSLESRSAKGGPAPSLVVLRIAQQRDELHKAQERAMRTRQMVADSRTRLQCELTELADLSAD